MARAKKKNEAMVDGAGRVLLVVSRERAWAKVVRYTSGTLRVSRIGLEDLEKFSAVDAGKAFSMFKESVEQYHVQATDQVKKILRIRRNK